MIIFVLWSYGIDSPRFVISENNLTDSVRLGTAVTKYVKAFFGAAPALLVGTKGWKVLNSLKIGK